MIIWKSENVYEHPDVNTDMVGNIIQHTGGTYFIGLGKVEFSCPQAWARKIHKAEGGKVAKSVFIGWRAPITLAEALEKEARDEGRAIGNLLSQIVGKHYANSK
jgi:hypothetical protein